MQRACNSLIMSIILIAFIITNPINSSVYNQTTAVPVAYRAVVLILLILISILLIWKVLKIFIAAVISFIVLIIIASTVYYFAKTGSFSLAYSMEFLKIIYNWFIHGYALNSLNTSLSNNVSKTIGGIKSAINSTSLSNFTKIR